MTNPHRQHGHGRPLFAKPSRRDKCYDYALAITLGIALAFVLFY